MLCERFVTRGRTSPPPSRVSTRTNIRRPSCYSSTPVRSLGTDFVPSRRAWKRKHVVWCPFLPTSTALAVPPVFRHPITNFYHPSLAALYLPNVGIR